jgi:hypothetical protein
MEPQPPKDSDESRPSKFPPQSRKDLDKLLSSLSQRLRSKPKDSSGEPSPRPHRKDCLCPCKDAEWRAQLDVPEGVLCVYSKVTGKDADGPHRDITLAVTYVNDRGEDDYTDITFCDSEVRWIMEALWHAPIWD